MREYQPFDVDIEVVSRYKVRVYARTPEQAEEEAIDVLKSEFEFPPKTEFQSIETLPIADESLAEADATGFPS